MILLVAKIACALNSAAQFLILLTCQYFKWSAFLSGASQGNIQSTVLNLCIWSAFHGRMHFTVCCDENILFAAVCST